LPFAFAKAKEKHRQSTGKAQEKHRKSTGKKSQGRRVTRKGELSLSYKFKAIIFLA
jgi:hypothetical protein